jgi:ribose transport system substrate-binding protein
MKATICDGKYNAGGAWTTCVNNAIAAKANAIVLVGMNCDPVQQPMEQAAAAGIKLMGVETPDCTPPLFNVQMKFGSTMPDNNAWYYHHGVQAADYIIAKTDGKAKILNSHGSEKNLALVQEGFTTTLKEHCPGCEIVNDFFTTTTDFVPNGPWIQALRSQLVRYGSQANAVFMPWDVEMAELGGAQAVQEAGLHNMILFGGQGQPTAWPLLRSGQITALTSAFDPGWLGYAAIDEINRALNGQPSVSEGIGYTLVDQSHNMPPAGQDQFRGTIDWKSDYLKAWGVG